MKPVPTLVALANEHEVRLLHNHGPANRLVDLAGHGTDDHFGHGAGSGPVPDHSSDGRKSRDRFAVQVVGVIEAAWKAGPYERLIIAAPAKMLGALRDALTPDLRAALYADLHKDLLKTPIAELPTHFADVMGP